MQTFCKRRAGLSATAGLSCLLPATTKATLIAVEVFQIRRPSTLTSSTEDWYPTCLCPEKHLYQYGFYTFFVFELQACRGQMDEQRDGQARRTMRPEGWPHNKCEIRPTFPTCCQLPLVEEEQFCFSVICRRFSLNFCQLFYYTVTYAPAVSMNEKLRIKSY